MVSAEMANYIPLGAAALCRPRFRDVDRVERGTQGLALKLNSATLLPRLARSRTAAEVGCLGLPPWRASVQANSAGRERERPAPNMRLLDSTATTNDRPLRLSPTLSHPRCFSFNYGSFETAPYNSLDCSPPSEPCMSLKL